MAEHLEILRCAFGGAGIRDRAREALALDRHLRHAGDLRRRAMPISSSSVGVRSLACRTGGAARLGRDALGPRDHQRIADAAAMGVLLVAAQRRVGGHRPAMREIGVGVRPADVVDARHLLRHRLGTEIVRAHGVDEAERPAFLARAVVGQHEDQRVVAHAGRFEERDQPRQMPVGMIEHAGEGRLQPCEHAPLVGAVSPTRPRRRCAAAVACPAARCPSPSAAPCAARARRPSRARTWRRSA